MPAGVDCCEGSLSDSTTSRHTKPQNPRSGVVWKYPIDRRDAGRGKSAIPRHSLRLHGNHDAANNRLGWPEDAPLFGKESESGKVSIGWRLFTR